MICSVTVPEDISFSDLRLSRDPSDGSLVLSGQTIRTICEANGLSYEWMMSGRDPPVLPFLVAWYEEHLARGGLPDPVQEDLLEELRLRDEHGTGFAHEPGHS